MNPKEISKGIFEIEKQGKMLVPARIYATKKLMEAIEDAAIQQVINVAELPGIQKYSIAQVDCHHGYGFCIGGVAAFDLEKGVVSPGGIGFDVNCTKGNTKILTEDGTKKIGKFEKKKFNVATIDEKRVQFVNPFMFMKFSGKTKRIFKIETEQGNKIKVTGEHPFLTKQGMKELQTLNLEQEVAILENEKIAFEAIEKIKETGKEEFVFDFNIPKTHNFIANNFVVSNCGVRILKTNLTEKDIKGKEKQILDELFNQVPAGLGSKGQFKANKKQLEEVMVKGSGWAVENGFGWEKDLETTEENGRMKEARIEAVSDKAVQRGLSQLGSLGSGNHFLEIQKIEEIFDEKTAEKFGLKEGNLTLMIHCGSRGFGHQIASDYLSVMEKAMNKYGIKVSDKQLACAPINSAEGKKYFSAMACAVNYAFANRQMITHRTRKSLEKVLGRSAEEMQMDLVYDVAHNIAKFEEHEIEGEKKQVLVHRKGATRAFPKGRKENPVIYADSGHPALIPGSMGTASWVVVGTGKGLEETFGSVAHGAGRIMSRSKAIKTKRGEQVQKELEEKGKFVKARSIKTLSEEMPEAYKDVDEVIRSLEVSGIAKKVARLTPIGVVKG